MNSKVKSFWEGFGITGDEMIFVLRRLSKHDARDLSNKDKVLLVKNIYEQRTKKDRDFINHYQNKMNKKKLKIKIENDKLLKIKAQNNFFNSEDKLQEYEEKILNYKRKIKGRMKSFNKNNNIYLLLQKY